MTSIDEECGKRMRMGAYYEGGPGGSVLSRGACPSRHPLCACVGQCQLRDMPTFRWHIFYTVGVTQMIRKHAMQANAMYRNELARDGFRGITVGLIPMSVCFVSK